MLTDFPNEIIGQNELLDLIDSFTLDTLPKSILMIGPKGCGKHTICNYLAWSHQLDLKELDNRVTDEAVEEILMWPNPRLYIVDLDQALPKLQNTLLKLIEEPPVGAYIVGLAESLITVLPTVQNRCQKWIFKGYSKQNLEQFIEPVNLSKKDVLLSLFTTPGQLIAGQNQDLSKVIDLANKMIDKIINASYSNTLSIVDKIAFKREEEKIDLLTLVRVLNRQIVDKIIEIDDNIYYQMFSLISQLEHRLEFSISKQRTFEEFLIELKEVAKKYGHSGAAQAGD